MKDLKNKNNAMLKNAPSYDEARVYEEQLMDKYSTPEYGELMKKITGSEKRKLNKLVESKG